MRIRIKIMMSQKNLIFKMKNGLCPIGGEPADLVVSADV